MAERGTEKRGTKRLTAASSTKTRRSKPAVRKETDVVERIKIDSDDSLAALRLFMKVYENL